jgi:beta-glucosidase
MIVFPKDFFWGAACAAHQVEGNNSNSDWWAWEKSGGAKVPSGDACRHYQLFKQDFDLAKTLNHNCHRLSIEWSRIQPQENQFSAEGLEHYKEVILALRERSIEPIVTLHHFTSPLWFAELGGWQSRKAVDYFLRYVAKVVETLSEKLNYWVTINEPMVYVYYSYIAGSWPPQERSALKAKKVMDNMVVAHIKAYRHIHAFYKEKKLAAPKVSIAHNMVDFLPCKNILRDRLFAGLRTWSFNHRFLNLLFKRKSLDFIGVNYYTRHLIDTRAWTFEEMVNNVCTNHHDTLPKNSLGWEIYPQGIFDVLSGLKKYRLPVFILENGICTADDNQRWEYIREHLKFVHRAIEAGLPVLGYVYWSLIDNFEWDKGFAPRFGLIEVDYQTYKRTIRGSARKFSEVCKTGIVPE